MQGGQLELRLIRLMRLHTHLHAASISRAAGERLQAWEREELRGTEEAKRIHLGGNEKLSILLSIHIK